MNKTSRFALAAFLLSTAFNGTANAHCEVPCGIYDDPMRFEMMLEDTRTIHKAMDQVNALSSASDALSQNQLVRWVTNKEKHAEKIQHVIAQYFMAQRIKAKDPKYLDNLSKAHAVIVVAMKCKQTVNPDDAQALKQAILEFQKTYEGK